MAKKAKAKPGPEASFEPGFRFGFDHGGSVTLVAVAAPIDRASPAVAASRRLVVRADVYGRLAEAEGVLGWQFAGSPFSQYLFGGYLESEKLADLSRQLQTIVASYAYEKTSGWQGFNVYDRGQSVETYTWGLDYSEEFAELAEEMGEAGGEGPAAEAQPAAEAEPTDGGEPLDHRLVVVRDKKHGIKDEYRFRSERRKVPAKMVSDEEKMLQAACEFYGLLMPSYDQLPADEKAPAAREAGRRRFVRVDLLARPGKEDMPAPDAQLKEAIKALDAGAVRAAVAAGARLDEVAGVARTPIQQAVAVGQRDPVKAAEVVRALVAAGVRADATASADAETPLLDLFDGLARASAKIIPLAEALLDAGADVNQAGRGLFMKGQTALHRAAMSGSVALVKFLHARGADVRATDPRGKTPRQSAEETVREYDKGWPGGEEVVPALRRVIEYLAAAEAGEAPAGDWRKEQAAEGAAADRHAREMKLKFAEFGKAMEALGEATKAEEAAKGKAVEEAVAALPDRFDVRRDDKARWKGAAARDKAAAALEAHGYERAGTFVVEQHPALRMLLLLHPSEHVYAAVCEQATKRWVDLVRYHKDGSTVTVTNAATDPAAEIDRPGHPKRRNKRWGPNKLVEQMRGEPAPAAVVPVTARQFPKRLAAFLHDEVAWRKAQRPV